MSQNKSKMYQNKRICLLKGGWNGERDISLQSAKGIYKALVSKGYDVVEYDLTRDLKALLVFLEHMKPDVVCVNALHGRDVEDGKIQSVLEILRLPYTGSCVSSSAVAFDKALSRTLLSQAGIPVPQGLVMSAQDVLSGSPFRSLTQDFGHPFVIKPLCEGSSLGVHIIHTQQDLQDVKATWSYGDHVLVERYIPGRELSVAVKGDQPLAILELQPSKVFYDYEAKYTNGVTKHVIPAVLEPDEQALILQTALTVVQALKVQGVTRVDFRYDDDRPLGQRHFVLELNTLPGMTALSIVPEIALYCGITYEDLCEWMVENPICPQ